MLANSRNDTLFRDIIGTKNVTELLAKSSGERRYQQ